MFMSNYRFSKSITDPELAEVTVAVFETAEMLAQQRLLDRALTDGEIVHRLASAGMNLPLPRSQQGVATICSLHL